MKEDFSYEIMLSYNDKRMDKVEAESIMDFIKQFTNNINENKTVHKTNSFSLN